jgi:hypothetical protein
VEKPVSSQVDSWSGRSMLYVSNVCDKHSYHFSPTSFVKFFICWIGICCDFLFTMFGCLDKNPDSQSGPGFRPTPFPLLFKYSPTIVKTFSLLKPHPHSAKIVVSCAKSYSYCSLNNVNIPGPAVKG